MRQRPIVFLAVFVGTHHEELDRLVRGEFVGGAFEEEIVPIEDYIGEAIDKYLQTYRPILARGKDAGSALWLAIEGEAMAEYSVREVITETTRSTLGVAINPHMFRTAGVTTSAIYAGDQPHLGGAILHHAPGPNAQKNYNRASCISAGRAYRDVIQRLRGH